MPSAPGTSTAQINRQQQIATIETQPSNPMPIPIVTCDLASDISTSEAGELEAHYYANTATTTNNNYSPASSDLNKPSVDTLKVSTIASTHNQITSNLSLPATSSTPNLLVPGESAGVAVSAAATTTVSSINNNGNSGGSSSKELRISPVPMRCRALSVGIDTDMVSEFDPSSSDSGVVSRCAVVKPLKFRLCQPFLGRNRNNQRRNESKAAITSNSNKIVGSKPSETAELEPAIPKVQKQRDPEKEKRRIARKKEKRATLILGLIMGSFIACWLPFFFLYILMPACSERCHIPDWAFSVAFWLGYMNSALNPAIYTIFNKDFRRAFRRILFK